MAQITNQVVICSRKPGCGQPDDAMWEWVMRAPLNREMIPPPYDEAQADYMMSNIRPDTVVVLLGPETARLNWIEAAANRYGVRLFDMRDLHSVYMPTLTRRVPADLKVEIPSIA